MMQGLVSYGSGSDGEKAQPAGSALPKPAAQQQHSISQPMHYANGGNRGGRHGIAHGRGGSP